MIPIASSDYHLVAVCSNRATAMSPEQEVTSMTSLIGIARCLGSNTVVGMGQKVGLARPFKVSDLIRLAPGYIVSPWTPVPPVSLQKGPNIWQAGHVNDVLAVPGGVLLATD